MSESYELDYCRQAGRVSSVYKSKRETTALILFSFLYFSNPIDCMRMLDDSGRAQRIYLIFFFYKSA